MSEPAPEEVQAEENPADEPAEEAVPAEETAEATGALVVKTDEELLAGVYKQLENFYGVVDAETVWEMLTTPTKSAFTRTMGAGAIAGRLMGGRAAKTAAANLLKGKVKSLGEGWTTKDPVPVKAFVKLLLPLPLRKSAYSDLIIYDFEQQGDCESFLAAYLVEQDGFLFASETNGCNQMKLLKSVRTPTRLALYEEWDDQESFMKSGTGRAEPSFLMQHLGADMSSGKFARLKGESAAVQGYALLAEDVREVMAPRTSSCAIITICEFKEKDECDAWLAHYLVPTCWLKRRPPQPLLRYRPTCPPGGSHGSGRKGLPRSAASAAWGLAVASRTRLSPRHS